MIHYALRCSAGHEFDGWFQSSAGFEAQAARGLLDCPVCADRDIQRAIMAPRLNKGGHTEPVIEAPKAEPPQPPAETVPATRATTLPMPAQVRAVLQRIRSEVERTCDYVGPRFADTARRIHAGEVTRRPIYGEATEDEAAALKDDGIEVSSVPWVPLADS
jgi:hypothetical protein